MSDLKDFVIKDGVLKKYVGNGGDVTIPDGVREIGKSAFFCCRKIKSVTIPAHIDYIDYWAFECCTGLTDVTVLGNNTRICRWAFYDCSPDLRFHVPENSNAETFALRDVDEKLWSDENYNSN